MTPDLLAYWLCGEIGAERTIASTTQLLDPVAGTWAWPVIERFGFPRGLFPPVQAAGSLRGRLRPELAAETGARAGLPTVAVASHDTASAFAAVSSGPGTLVVSCGTWSLVGVELPAPVLTHAALAANLTNEAGIGGSVRFLRNTAGLWLVQECRRAWARAGVAHDYAELERLASAAPAFGPLIDPDDPGFLAPGDMPARVAAFCARTAQAVPDGPGATIRCVLESLTLVYRELRELIEAVTGEQIRRLHIIGGGAHNRLHSRLAAGATGLPTLAGPAEATALGNVLTQALALGAIGSVAELREVAGRSATPTAFEPGDDRDQWDEAYARFRQIRSMSSGRTAVRPPVDGTRVPKSPLTPFPLSGCGGSGGDNEEVALTMAATTGMQTVEPDRAAEFLRERYGSDVSSVERLGHGEWSTAYGFRRGDEALVIRFGQHPDDFQRDRIAARYTTSYLPIPRVLEIGEAFDAWFAVSERAFGTPLDDLDGDGMRALLPSLLDALDAMREADISATHGFGNWDATGNAPHPSWRALLLDPGADEPGGRTSGWRANLAGSPTGDGPYREASGQLHAIAAGLPEVRHLIHSDLLNFNVLVDDRRIASVFDWGCSCYGDFLYDLAWFVYYWPWYPAWVGIDVTATAAAHYAAIGLEVPAFAERLRACVLHIGLGSQAYNAFKGRQANIAADAARTLAFARAPLAVTAL